MSLLHALIALLHPTPLQTGLTVVLDPPAAYRESAAVLALTAIGFGECRGQGLACIVAVQHTALNRARAHMPARYGRGITGVIGKPFAFSCLNERDPNWRVIQAGLEGRLRKHSPDGTAWTLSLGSAREIAGPHRTIDPTRGSTHYHAARISPAWVHDRGMTRVAVLGSHVFYRKAS